MKQTLSAKALPAKGASIEVILDVILQIIAVVQALLDLLGLTFGGGTTTA